jgi:alkanesulfonate monooxygenase SsuD/methylene tetrahydromethanopterin reductase-like flavin-dependent oxidoreductase (luciferase family)
VSTTAWDRPAHPWVVEGAERVRFGIAGGVTADWPASIAWVRQVEALGFDSIWIADHPVLTPVDPFAALAAFATVTSRLRLGVQVGCIYYRHPVLAARLAADVQRLSGGRMVLGLGIGDYREEFAAMGMAYPPVPERQAALAEYIPIVADVLAGETITREGRHYAVREARLRAGSAPDERVPILLAGGGERVTLRQVAELADATNLGPANLNGDAWTTEDVRRKHAVLRGHCERIGRPYDSVLRTHRLAVRLRRDAPRAFERAAGGIPGEQYLRLTGTPRDAVDLYLELVDAGVRYFTAVVPGDEETLRRLGEEVLPEVVRRAPPSAGG